MEKKIKVLFIDPWGVNETGEYTNGLCGELQKYVKLTLVTNYYFENKAEIKNLQKVFFKRSETMQTGIFRKIIRGLEYIRTWKKIIKDAKREKYDIVHINWLLMYRFDCRILKKLKKCSVKIVYTAHNIVPHISGEHYVPELRKIYGMVDKIIIHGESLKLQFIKLFPSEATKLYIQKHGYNLYKNISYEKAKVESEIVNKIERYERKVLFIGNVFEAKGTDRLLRIWLECNELNNTLLIIAGRETENGTEWSKKYAELKKQAQGRGNIMILDYFVPNNTANYLIDSSNLIVLPYREASMSGVVFTAVDFKKPILSTDVGAISEYIHGFETCIAENNDTALASRIIALLAMSLTNQLKELGERFSEHIKQLCSWSTVVQKLYYECYLQVQ